MNAFNVKNIYFLDIAHLGFVYFNGVKGEASQIQKENNNNLQRI